MADSNYQTLRAADEEITTSGPHDVDRETRQGPTSNARTPQAAYTSPVTRSPEPTTSTNIPHAVDQGRHAREPDVLQHNAPLLSGPEITSDPQDQTRHDDLGNRFQEHAPDESAEKQSPKWKMFYFRLPFLVSFSILLAGIIAALEALYYVSQHNQGLVTASESMHYVWTYGPTFVLTMIAASWGQLEQRAKQIMPWSLMSRGETTAKHSLMLNYITSSMLGSLSRSLKRRHFLVSLGLLGSLILRLSIIFSSGLLRLEYRSVTSATVLSYQDTFDTAKDVDFISWRTFLPVMNSAQYWSIIKYGLSYPSGLTPQLAVQSFNSSDDGTYDDLTGDVQVFESTLQDCEDFKFTYNTGGSTDTFRLTMPMNVPSSLLEKLKLWCYDNHVTYSSSGSVGGGILNEFVNLTQLVYKCPNGTTKGDSQPPREEQEHRVLFTSESWLSVDESEVSGFMCRPEYSLTRRVVTNITHDVGRHDNLKIAGLINETLDLGIPSFNLTKNIFRSLGGEDAQGILDVEWNLWYALVNVTQPQHNLSNFRNTSLMIEVSKQVWQGLSAFVVKHDYTSPLNQTFNGTATSTQGRLSAQELPLRLVEALTALLLVFTVALCFLRPGVFHRDPTSLGAHAMIMARSPGLMALLEGHGAASKQALRNKLSGFLASYPQKQPPESPAIALQEFRKGSEKPAEEAATDNSAVREWWRPIPVRWWFRTCILVATLGVMIALEVLLQLSARKDGLGDVTLDGYLKYTWTLLPPFLLALIGMLFSMVDSTARTIHPFQLLRRGRASLSDILYDPARQVSLLAVAHAAWKRHFPLLLAMLPGLLAPILTIITSGLYTVMPVPWTYGAELQLQDWFRPEETNLGSRDRPEGDNGEAWNMFKLIQFTGMPLPDWTHGEYALSSFGADNLRSHDGNDSSLYVTARVPAVHSNLNCSMIGRYVGEDRVPTNNAMDINDPTLDSIYLRLDPGPLGCNTPPEWNETAGHRDIYLYPSDYSSEKNSKKVGTNYYLAFYTDNYDTVALSRDHHLVQEDLPNGLCGDGRGHHFFGLGHGQEELALLHCTPYVETLWVSATFSLPDLSIVTDMPVVPDVDSSVFLSHVPAMSGTIFVDWGDIVSALVNGSSKVGSLADLMPGPGDDEARKLKDALGGILGEFSAQHLHFNYREPLDGSYNGSNFAPGSDPLTPDGQPATGNVTDRTRLRLIQNEVSTRVLQSLLAVMLVCLVAESLLGRGVRIIPRDPGSVASRMAYFADGTLWKQVPVGADRWKDKEIVKWGRENTEGRLLLDWWGGNDRDSDSAEDGAPQSVGGARRFAVESVGPKGAV